MANDFESNNSSGHLEGLPFEAHQQLYRQYHLRGDSRYSAASPEKTTLRWMAVNRDASSGNVRPPLQSIMPPCPVIGPTQRKAATGQECRSASLTSAGSHTLAADDYAIIQNLKHAFSEQGEEAGLIERITCWLKAFDASLKFDGP